MRINSSNDKWTAGYAYEAFMGRWSYRLAEKFLRWIDPEQGLAWLDIGFGEGTVAAYVWDYAGRMEYLRIFWDEVIEMDPWALELDDGAKFPICNQGALESIFQAAGLQDVKSSAIGITFALKHSLITGNHSWAGQDPLPLT